MPPVFFCARHNMWQEILIAVSLLLVLEGILPFLNPRGFRQAMLQAAQMNDRTMRIMGLITMLSGLAMLYWVK